MVNELCSIYDESLGRYVRRPLTPDPVVGDRFGGLEVIGSSAPIWKGKKNRKRRKTLFCRCDCGVEKAVEVSRLKLTRPPISCGCKKAAVRLFRSEAAFRSLFRQYKSNAKTREKNFTLSREEFRTLISGNCFYCGKRPSQVWDVSDRYTNHIPEPLIYNGVDRKDNAVGYEYSNCVSCCSLCNYIKREMSIQQFVGHIRSILNHLTKEERSCEQ